MNINDFHLKRYDAHKYNCSHFVRDLWLFLVGTDIADLVGAWNSGNLSESMAKRSDLIRLNEACGPCIALFQKAGTTPHIGVFIEEKIFHMTPEGPRLQELSFVSQQYTNVKFYRC